MVLAFIVEPFFLNPKGDLASKQSIAGKYFNFKVGCDLSCA